MKQNNSLPPRRRILTLAVCSALASLAAAPAFADPMLTIKLFRDSEVMFRDADMSRWADNYVELGVGYNSADSLRFGQFSGLTDNGGFPIAGFNWISRDQKNDAQYWQIHGANLGLDSRKLKAEGGVQGAWDVSFSFDGLKKSQTESPSFVHNGLGTNNLTMPTGWLAPATFAQDPTLTALLRPFEIAHGRDIYRLGLKGLLGNEWDYKVNYREDRRDGARMTGFALTTGGRSIIVPYAIDDKTSQIDMVLSYTSKISQFQLGYHYSRFTNNFNAFNVQNPFVAAGAATQNAALSLAPGNDLHQITATGGYKFSKDTRLSATLSRSIGKQNDAFLPFSANVASAAAPLPKGSLEGEVVKTLLDIALTARPMDKMNLKVAYRYHDDKNRTPIQQFTYYSRDTTAVPAVASNSTRSNAPISTTEKRSSVDADYEIAPKTTLRAGFEHTDKSYTLTDVTGTKTNKLSLEVRRPILDEFQGALGYTHTQRRSPGYDKSVFFTNTYTNPTFQAAAAGRLTNHPSMRSFLYADFDEDRLRTSGNWTVSETLSLQGSIDAHKQKMRGPDCGQFTNGLQQLAITGALPDICLGRDTATGASASLDLQYQPEENLTTFAFLNLAQTGVREIGRQWNKTTASTGSNAARDFYGEMDYTDQTAGFGLKWQPEEKWDLGGTYVLNLGRGTSDVTTAAGYAQANSGTGGSVPDTWSRLHSLQLFAKWDYSKQLSWRFNYLYENLRSYDWAVSDVGAQSNAGILLTGQQAPRYSNHVFGVSAVVKSW
jgi:MtrB/PioB family decaheme-associated outer membrane protein